MDPHHYGRLGHHCELSCSLIFRRTGIGYQLVLRGASFSWRRAKYLSCSARLTVPLRVLEAGHELTFSLQMTLMGLVHNAAGLQAARFFLGVAEGGLFPGINFMLTCWVCAPYLLHSVYSRIFLSQVC